MKKTVLLTALTLSLAACQSTQVKQDNHQSSMVKSGITTVNMDRSVRPQDDFYRHVNGKWLNEFEIPADKSNFGAFNKLGDESRADVQAIIDVQSSIYS